MAAGTVLITGAAGFIGYHIARRLLEDGRKVVGVDNLEPYYDPILKEDRWNQLEPFEGFSMETFDIAESERLRALFERERPSEVVHLAAQAGVRYSLENPDAYARTNVVGFLNVLEACRAFPVNHLVAA
jgi:UDP-glucuronate 4-epimerase